MANNQKYDLNLVEMKEQLKTGPEIVCLQNLNKSEREDVKKNLSDYNWNFSSNCGFGIHNLFLNVLKSSHVSPEFKVCKGEGNLKNVTSLEIGNFSILNVSLPQDTKRIQDVMNYLNKTEPKYENLSIFGNFTDLDPELLKPLSSNQNLNQLLSEQDVNPMVFSKGIQEVNPLN